MPFTRHQYKILADFFSSVAKGMFLLSAAGFSGNPDVPLGIKVGYGILWIVIALLFLFAALVLTREENHDKR